MKCLVKLVFLLLLIFGQLAIGASSVSANIDFNCKHRYLTLVNPVRGRDLWINKSTQPLDRQYAAIRDFNFPATWLVQYDALIDSDVSSILSTFNESQEVGVLLEVSPKLAKEAGVIYPSNLPWAAPNAVFLSAYSPSERRRLIDALYFDYRKYFGVYPKSIGAWWIDSYSINYIEKKFGLDAVLIVADQKTTDHFGVWGQWWGVPYYPSSENLLKPAGSIADKVDAVVIQWAQRHPDLALGDGPEYSNYSFQANDYLSLNKNTTFFKDMLATYLSCANPLAQVTVGLETGMESEGFFDEYQKQLTAISELEGVETRSMSGFYSIFKDFYPDFPRSYKITKTTQWEMTIGQRVNANLGSFVNYAKTRSFSDYFIPDRSDFLDRNLEKLVLGAKTRLPIFPYHLVGVVVITVLLLAFSQFATLLFFLAFSCLTYWFFLRNTFMNGWYVVYGPEMTSNSYLGLLAVLVSFFCSWFLAKKLNSEKRGPTALALFSTYGLFYLIDSARFISLVGTSYVGLATTDLTLVGLKFGSSNGLFIKEFDFHEAAAFLGLNIATLNNLPVWFVVIPAVQALLVILCTKFYTKYPKWAIIVFSVLVPFSIMYIKNICFADPTTVLRI